MSEGLSQNKKALINQYIGEICVIPLLGYLIMLNVLFFWDKKYIYIDIF
jgi:hypothetical protein